MSMCACMGPQRGEPLCPCKMRAVERSRPRAPQLAPPGIVAQGCICPPGAEKSCQGAFCPRRPVDLRSYSTARSL